MRVSAKDRDHWAFRPLNTANALARLLNPASLPPTASRQTLIRRAYFGLLGLPPSPEEVQKFETDADPAAYDKLVDRLLESEHFGERWGRHWLDAARYADSDGYEGDRDRPLAWPYRDWVIRALNSDLPYDQFVRWQIAGDEFEPANPDAVVATGFLAAGPVADTTPADTEENKLKIRYDELDDMLSTVGTSMLALTIGCARCHDHKFDPIPTRDYYRLLAAFQGTERAVTFLSKPHRERAKWIADRHSEYREFKMNELGLSEDQKFWLRQPEHFFVPIQVELYKKYGARLKSTDDELRRWLPRDKQETWTALDTAAELNGVSANVKSLIAFDHSSTPRPAFLLSRGDVMDRKTPVTLGFLQVLPGGDAPERYLESARPPALNDGVCSNGFTLPPTTFQRKALALWLTDAEHGAGALLARVIVNRVWQGHFGEGLVRTSNDFGRQGTEPTDPDLLDTLATDLIRNGWKLKRLHRLILTSALYRTEPGNTVSGVLRRPVRLEAETLRDSILAVSGRLNRKMFGPPYRPFIPKEAIATRSKDEYPTDLKDGVDRWRRSIYAFTKRSVPNPFMEVFDAPDSTTSCTRRNTTTVPTQALTLLNDEFVRGSAVQFAQRVITDVGDNPKAQVDRAFRLALSRAPRAEELDRALTFVARSPDAHADAIAVDGLTDFCHVLLTLNEFLYIE